MSVVKVVILHASVAYGLVLEAWVVEDAAAEVLGTAAVAAAVAQDTGGAQAMVEGATVHVIVLQGGELTASHHCLPAPEASAGHHRLPAHEASAGHHRLLVHEASAGHHRLPVHEAIAGPQHIHPRVRNPLMLIMRDLFVPNCWKC